MKEMERLFPKFIGKYAINKILKTLYFKEDNNETKE